MVRAESVPSRRVADAIGDLGLPHVQRVGEGTTLVAESVGVRAIRTLGRRVQRHVAGLVSAEGVWVGVSGPIPVAGTLGAARREADDAIRLGRLLMPAARVVLFDDVVLAAAVTCDPVLHARIGRLLDPIADYDRRGKGNLLPTLEAFADAGFSTALAAHRLGIHRHTLVYRLQRAEQVLGRSVRFGADRTLVEAALLARRLPVGGA